MNASNLRSDKTTVKRIPKRGVYERDVINAILDEGFICHVAFIISGQPYVIPTGYARLGDWLYIHGSSASRMLRNLSKGVDVCVSVTLIDGLVLARSAFHHSMNYRSVVILGRADIVDDSEKKNTTTLELKATTVLCLPITEASAKIRRGDPVDDDEDYAMDVWAGVLPIELSVGQPLADARLDDSVSVPDHVAHYRRMKTE